MIAGLRESASIAISKMLILKSLSRLLCLKYYCGLLAIIFQPNEDYQEKLHAEPNIFCHFAEGTGEPKYMAVKKFETLQRTLTEALESHNDVLPAMPLVLFDDAIKHM